MSKTYNMIRLINYELAKLRLKLAKEGELIKFKGKEFHNLTVEGKVNVDKYQFW